MNFTDKPKAASQDTTAENTAADTALDAKQKLREKMEADDDEAFRRAIERKNRGKKIAVMPKDDDTGQSAEQVAQNPLTKDKTVKEEKLTVRSVISTIRKWLEKHRKPVLITLIVIVGLLLSYLIFAFIPVGPIANLRRLYIQTAMSTADHQWLATMIFPSSVIDDAWEDPGTQTDHPEIDLDDLLPATTDDTSDVTDTTETEPDSSDTTETEAVTEEFPTEDDILGLSALKVGDTDYAGSTVIVANEEEGLFISEFEYKSSMVPGTKFHGYAMVVDDPSRVFIGTTPEKNNRGYRIGEMMDYYGDVVAGLNASSFADPNNSGRGCDIIGACMSEGKSWGNYLNSMASVLLTTDNKLVVGWTGKWSGYTNIRDGMQFGPVLVYKGKNQIDEKTGGGMGIQPRAAIGQREDGAIIMIVIDGRVTSSIGCTMWEMADMMMKYGAVTAGGCDGGSSVVLAYEGDVLNENSSANPTYGRRIPNAFMVRSKKAEETE